MKRMLAARTLPLARWSIFIPAFIFLAALTTLWALASPILSGPDETAHATKAVALAHGEIVGHQVAGQKYPVVTLPNTYRYSPQIICFASHPDVAADCGARLGDAAGAPYFSTWVSGYNPAYYALVGWPSLFLGGSSGIFAIRVVSGLISAAMLAWAFQTALASKRSRWMPAGILFVASPMVVYMAAMVNPQGLEISAATALWIGLLRLLQTFRAEPRDSVLMSRRHLWIIVTVSAALLVTARSLGPLWLVIVAALAVMVVGWSPARRIFTTARSYLPIAVIALAGIFSVGWTLSTGTLAGQAGIGDVPLVGGTVLQGTWATLRGTPAFIEQAAGVFGWLDTALPGSVYALYFVALALLVIIALLSVGRAGFFKLAIVTVAAFVVPILVQGYSVHQTGMIWQGRYGIFLYIGIPIVAGWLLSKAISSRIDYLSARLTAVSAGLLGLFSVLAFFLALHRYVVGAHQPIFSMVHGAEWQPPLGWAALCVIFAVVVVGYTAWIIRVAILAGRRDDEPATSPIDRDRELASRDA